MHGSLADNITENGGAAGHSITTGLWSHWAIGADGQHLPKNRKAVFGSGSWQQAVAWLQHRWPAAASAAHVSTFMVLEATACLQRPAEHVGMHTRGILGIMCVMGMCIRSRLEVLYGHEHNVERHRLYARIM